MATYLGFLLQVKGVYLVQLSFLLKGQQSWRNVHHGGYTKRLTYQLEEEGCLVCLQSSLRVRKRGRAVAVILCSKGRSS